MRLRRWAITAVTVLSVAAVSACGSSDSNANSDNPGGSNTSTPTTEDGSTGSGDSGSGDSSSDATSVDALTARALGDAMAKAATDAGSAHMVMTAGSTAGNVTMSGDIGGMGQKLDALELGMKMKIPGTGTGTAEMRIVDAAFYMKIPGLGLGSKWLKVPLDDPSNPLGSVYSQLATFTDPDALQASFSAFKKFTDLGAESVDGVEARHYQVTVDTAKSLKASGLDKIGGLPLKDLLKSMPKQTTSDLWLDSHNHIVKMTSDATASSTYEIHYSSWGKPVHVSAPPANQVAQLPY